MKLNTLERLAMNNPVRRWLQVHYEAARFERLGGKLQGARVLEVGCGRGVGVSILFDRFGAAEVHALDFDPSMVELARRSARAASWKSRLFLSAGDASSLQYSDATFDAVVDFGALHHIPDWRSAVAEIARVLRPGGLLYFEEVPRELLDGWVLRTAFEHPRDDRFTRDEFVAELQTSGLQVLKTERLPLAAGIFVGVATRNPVHLEGAS